MTYFIASVLLFVSKIYFTQAVEKDSCTQKTAGNGLLDCVNLTGYSTPQWAICATNTLLEEKTGRQSYCSGTYCWYPCMVITAGEVTGSVSESCQCNLNQNKPQSSINMKCYIPSRKDCDWYTRCLNRCLTFSSVYRLVMSVGKKQCQRGEFCLQRKLYHLLFSNNTSCKYRKEEAIKAFVECSRQTVVNSLSPEHMIYEFWIRIIFMKAISNDNVCNIDRFRWRVPKLYKWQKQILMTVKRTERSKIDISTVTKKVAKILKWETKEIIWDWESVREGVFTVDVSIVFIPRGFIYLAQSSKNNTNMKNELDNIEKKMKQNGFKDQPIIQIIIPERSHTWTATSKEFDIEFLLFTRSNNETKQLLDPNNLNTIKNSFYEKSAKTVFIIHGFRSTIEKTKWILEMKTALLQKEDINVVIVDWGKAANLYPLQYNTAAKKPFTLGFVTAALIKCLYEKFNTQLTKIHIIGHSLGAHAAGFAGLYTRVRVGIRIGRISGLDPARPEFEGKDTDMRLDASDADFVDVIHTDGGFNSYGLETPSGDVDFYPNGGKVQPGCYWPKNWNFACSHERVTSLFIESINSDCFEACLCNEAEYNKKPCNTSCTKMGYGIDTQAIRGTYYLDTNSEKPYCTGKKPGQS